MTKTELKKQWLSDVFRKIEKYLNVVEECDEGSRITYWVEYRGKEISFDLHRGYMQVDHGEHCKEDGMQELGDELEQLVTGWIDDLKPLALK